MAKVYIYQWIVTENYVVTIKGFGIDHDGNRVCVVVENFLPHVYILESASPDLSSCVKILIEEKCNLYNFEPGLKTFIKGYFRSKSAIHNFIKENKLENKVHEHNASTLLQFTTERNLKQIGWIEFEGEELEMEGLSDKYYTCDFSDVNQCLGPYKELLGCAFDLEVYSTVLNAMPSNKPGDEIFQVSVVFSDGESYLISLEGRDYDDDVIQVKDEKTLLLTFLELLKEKRPMLLYGYNILGFDINYIIKRCIRLFLLDELMSFGYGSDEAELKTVKWSSSAFGEQEFTYLAWEGIVILDLYPIVKRDYKFSNYKLETVASSILGHGKDPITVKDIVRAYETKYMKTVGLYCVKDSKLCIDLADKLGLWIGLVEMANICNVQPMVLYIQGQQIRIYSQVYKYCNGENIVVNTSAYKTPQAMKYTGAYVMEPVPGLYTNVIPFDFSSLYPSIIITENICYSTIASEATPDSDCNIFKWEDHIGCSHDPKVIKDAGIGDKIKELDEKIKLLRSKRDSSKAAQKKELQKEINVLMAKQKPLRAERADLKIQYKFAICCKNRFRFLKESIKKGVIPTIIKNLLDSRAAIKKQIKNETDSFKKIVLDKQQLAYKVSANSMYGAMGVRSGYLPYMPGAMTVTHCGREAIKKSLKLIESLYNGKVIYGDTDSNYVQFPHIEESDLWDSAIKIAKKVSEFFPKTMKLEFEEKIYKQFIMLGKKKYIFNELDSNLKIGYKGVVLARRDNPKIVRDLYLECASKIFLKLHEIDILYFLIERLCTLAIKCAPEDFVLTKAVGSLGTEYNHNDGRLGNYKVKALPFDEDCRYEVLGGKDELDYYHGQLPAHMQLVARMAKRGVPVSTGTRLEFVVLDNSGPKLRDKVEEFDYFKLNSKILKLDYDYYIKCMINPIDQLLNIVFRNADIISHLSKIIIHKNNVLKELKAKFRPKLVFVKRM